jgi:hypothetical protein
MKTFKYSIICEDDSQRYFAETLLKLHFTGKVVFVFDELFYKRFKCGNNRRVYRSYPIQIERSSYLDPYNLDLVLVGIDYDDRPKKDFKAELAKLYDRLNDKAKQKAVIFFPVQAIEHWLVFLKHRAANPSSTKTITVETENTNRKDAKLKIYGHPPQDKKELITNLVQSLDVDWLCTQSHSFSEFYNRILHVIDR